MVTQHYFWGFFLFFFNPSQISPFSTLKILGHFNSKPQPETSYLTYSFLDISFALSPPIFPPPRWQPYARVLSAPLWSVLTIVWGSLTHTDFFGQTRVKRFSPHQSPLHVEFLVPHEFCCIVAFLDIFCCCFHVSCFSELSNWMSPLLLQSCYTQLFTLAQL